MFNQCLLALFYYKQCKKFDKEHEIDMLGKINRSWKRLLMVVGLL